MRLNFKPAAALVSVAKKTADFCQLYDTEVLAATAFIVPTVSSWTVFSPWAAVPVTVGSAIWGLGISEGDSWIGAKAGARVGLSLLCISAGINEWTDRSAPTDTVKNTLNGICWTPGKEIKIDDNDKTWIAQIPAEGITNFITKKLTASGDEAEPIQQTHSANAIVSFPYKSFWKGELVQGQTEVSLAARPGLWKDKTDTVYVSGTPVTLKCDGPKG